MSVPEIADPSTRPLDQWPVGTRGVLRAVRAAGARRRRLAELGFVPGAAVEVVGRGAGGLVVGVNADARVAIDRAGAEELWVAVHD
ncbi:ferrous iron transport protein A [Actinomycetospora chiangmaiensis]|uniref:ferrous iron transport protein A n=1 Tax=Actinomycetospora chiangmaiensis TaxID=402650 RepID=UPI000370BDD4|nr:ferrous iron transport protein A [Actinomycetospora chiangmaiensis]